MKTTVTQVDTFGQLVGICKSQGSMFNPRQASASVEALESLLATAREKTQNVYDGFQALTLATNQRRFALEQMRRIVTRAYNAAIASDMEPALLENLKNMKAKIHGLARAKAASNPESNNESSIPIKTGRGPIPQASAVTQIKNFNLFIKILELDDNYSPNEQDLTIDSLYAVLSNLEARQSELHDAHLAYRIAKDECNAAVFQKKGIYGISKLVKVYVKSAFGSTSTAFKNVRKLSFKNK